MIWHNIIFISSPDTASAIELDESTTKDNGNVSIGGSSIIATVKMDKTNVIWKDAQHVQMQMILQQRMPTKIRIETSLFKIQHTYCA
jgi:hypothetical protein